MGAVTYEILSQCKVGAEQPESPLEDFAVPDEFNANLQKLLTVVFGNNATMRDMIYSNIETAREHFKHICIDFNKLKNKCKQLTQNKDVLGTINPPPPYTNETQENTELLPPPSAGEAYHGHDARIDRLRHTNSALEGEIAQLKERLEECYLRIKEQAFPNLGSARGYQNI